MRSAERTNKSSRMQETRLECLGWIGELQPLEGLAMGLEKPRVGVVRVVCIPTTR